MIAAAVFLLGSLAVGALEWGQEVRLDHNQRRHECERAQEELEIQDQSLQERIARTALREGNMVLDGLPQERLSVLCRGWAPTVLVETKVALIN